MTRFVLTSSAQSIAARTLSQEQCGKKLYKTLPTKPALAPRQIIYRSMLSEYIILFGIEDTQEIHRVR